MLKGFKIYSMVTGNCPVCHKESMYVETNPYRFNSILKMHNKCSCCQTKYQMEPSFFYGAMYVSYALGVMVAVATFVIAYFFIGIGALYSFFSIMLVLFLLMPILMRLSRNIWINLFMHYDPKKAK